jgi:phospholipid/cholesterol/gamma-HCH transport system permease protein
MFRTNGVLLERNTVVAMLSLIGQLVMDLAYLAKNPGRIPWREISVAVYRSGAQALPIMALLGFLVGIVLSYLSARELQSFGAELYVVNIIGVGVVREIGGLLAAILVAGRSGSAITAQLGVMRITQELDALIVMGISPTVRLILPKLIALAVSLPLLVLWTDVIALAGGMLAVDWRSHIGYHQFLSLLPGAVPIANLWLGLGKGTLFGVLIGLIACYRGLRIKPDTASLGSGTTASVVYAIMTVIAMDALAAVAFADVGMRYG